MAVGPMPRNTIAPMSETNAVLTSRMAAGANGTVAITPAATPQNVAVSPST